MISRTCALRDIGFDSHHFVGRYCTDTMIATANQVATVIEDIQDRNDNGRVYYGSGGYRLSRPVLAGKDSKKTFESIPTVDVANVFSPDFEVRNAIAKEVAKACEEVGFFYAINPPVSYEKMSAYLHVSPNIALPC